MLQHSNPAKLIRRNGRVCVLASVFLSMFLGTSFMTSYYLSKGLSQTEVFVLQLVLYISYILSDIPFGWLADRRGNRCVMIVGAVIALLQGLYFPWCSTFWQFSPALVATGLYQGALTGALHAAMDFSINTARHQSAQLEERLKDRLFESYLTAEARWICIGAALGTVIGGILHDTWSLQAPYVAQPLVYAALLAACLCLVQPPQPRLDKSETRKPTGSLLVMAYRLLRTVPAVRSVVCLLSVTHSTTMCCFWVIQPRMHLAGIPESWYAGAYFVWAASMAIMAETSSRIARWQPLRAWGMVVALSAVGVFVAGQTTGVVGAGLLFVVAACDFIIAHRLALSSLRKTLPEGREDRNAELAVTSTAMTLCVAASGLAFGYCVDRYGLQASLTWLGIIAGVLGILSLWSLKRAVT